MTINDKKPVLEALCNGGRLEDFTFPFIYSYEAVGSGQSYMQKPRPDLTLFALFTCSEHDDLQGHDTQFCRNVIALMVNGMLTPDGQELWQNCN